MSPLGLPHMKIQLDWGSDGVNDSTPLDAFPDVFASSSCAFSSSAAAFAASSFSSAILAYSSGYSDKSSSYSS